MDVVTSTGTTQVNLLPFTAATVSNLNARDFAVKFDANQEILVSCGRGRDDYSNLLPLDSKPLYHWDSTNSRLSSVDCTTLGTTGEIPVGGLSGFAYIR